MKAHDLIGKKIVRIDQRRTKVDEADTELTTVFDRIVLDNGTVLYCSVHEGGCGDFYEVSMHRTDIQAKPTLTELDDEAARLDAEQHA